MPDCPDGYVCHQLNSVNYPDTATIATIANDYGVSFAAVEYACEQAWGEKTQNEDDDSHQLNLRIPLPTVITVEVNVSSEVLNTHYPGGYAYSRDDIWQKRWEEQGLPWDFDEYEAIRLEDEYWTEALQLLISMQEGLKFEAIYRSDIATGQVSAFRDNVDLTALSSSDRNEIARLYSEYVPELMAYDSVAMLSGHEFEDWDENLATLGMIAITGNDENLEAPFDPTQARTDWKKERYGHNRWYDVSDEELDDDFRAEILPMLYAQMVYAGTTNDTWEEFQSFYANHSPDELALLAGTELEKNPDIPYLDTSDRSENFIIQLSELGHPYVFHPGISDEEYPGLDRIYDVEFLQENYANLMELSSGYDDAISQDQERIKVRTATQAESLVTTLETLIGEIPPTICGRSTDGVVAAFNAIPQKARQRLEEISPDDVDRVVDYETERTQSIEDEKNKPHWIESVAGLAVEVGIGLISTPLDFLYTTMKDGIFWGIFAITPFDEIFSVLKHVPAFKWLGDKAGSKIDDLWRRIRGGSDEVANAGEEIVQDTVEELGDDVAGEVMEALDDDVRAEIASRWNLDPDAYSDEVWRIARDNDIYPEEALSLIDVQSRYNVIGEPIIGEDNVRRYFGVNEEGVMAPEGAVPTEEGWVFYETKNQWGVSTDASGAKGKFEDMATAAANSGENIARFEVHFPSGVDIPSSLDLDQPSYFWDNNYFVPSNQLHYGGDGPVRISVTIFSETGEVIEQRPFIINVIRLDFVERAPK